MDDVEEDKDGIPATEEGIVTSITEASLRLPLILHNTSVCR
jgi:hypothetical protein